MVTETHKIYFGSFSVEYTLCGEYESEVDDVVFSSDEVEKAEFYIASKILEQGICHPKSFKFLRKTFGITLSDLSDQWGVDKDKLRKIEDGCLFTEEVFRNLCSLVKDHARSNNSATSTGPVN